MSRCIKLFLGILFVFVSWEMQGQNGTCTDPKKLCPSGTTFNLTSGLTVPLLGGYGCVPLLNILTTYARFQIASPGNLTMNISNLQGPNISYVVWGPYSSDAQINTLLGGACGLLGLLGGGPSVACGGGTSTSQSFTLNNVTQGQIYVIMISKQLQLLLPPDYFVTISEVAGGASIGPTFTTTSANISCNGANNGSIVINNPLGNGSITYAINNSPFSNISSFNNLPPNTYNIHVKDNNCTTTKSVIITQPSALSHSTTKIDATTCPGNGSINVSGSGGTAPYQYSINGGTNYYPGTNPKLFGGLIAGTYSVMIKDTNNCVTGTTNVPLTGPTIPTVTVVSFIHPTCTNNYTGSITFSGTGGIAPYTYSIDNGSNYFPSVAAYTASSLNQGTYQLKVKAASGCESNMFSQVLTGQHPPPLGTITGSTICPGGQATLTFNAIAGTGPFNLLINSNNYTGISTGVPFNVTPNPTANTSYSLTQIIDNYGCITN